MNDLIELARKFSMEAHDAIGQKRKYTGLPYWTHTANVAATVAAHGGTPEIISAAYLHDTLEDTKVTEAELLKAFPVEVVRYVVELTDVYSKETHPHLNRAQRKQLEAERIRYISDNAKTIKLADLYDNTESIVQHDPEFASVYLKEKAAVIKWLDAGNFTLYRKVVEQLTRELAKVN